MNQPADRGGTLRAAACGRKPANRSRENNSWNK
jgi:hypothetical protein